MLFRQIFDPKLAQYAYLIGCQKTKEAIVIDPERDIDQYLRIAEEEDVRIVAVAETHIHADFLSGAREFAERLGVRLYLSAEGEADGWGSNWAKNGKYDVVFLRDGDTFNVGNIEFRAMHTPGHTPEHMSYLVTDRGGGATEPMGIATGDFVFVGDLGRPDLLESAAKVAGMREPSARKLYESAKKFFLLPDYLQVWPGHGAGSACGKALGAIPESTVGYEKRYNASLAPAQDDPDLFMQNILSGQPEPPMYFARMKQYNRDGVPLLGTLPAPQRLSAQELQQVVDKGEWTIVDTRLDREEFMRAHIPGSLYAPLRKTFNTVVGSLVTDDQTPLVLIIEEHQLQTAIRDLVRIGYDNIVAWATPESLLHYFDNGGPKVQIDQITFDQAVQQAATGQVQVLDVRYASEYESGHVPGAINASYTRLPEYLDRIPKDKPLAVHCLTGIRASVASAYLAAQSYKVLWVNDDFDDYKRKGTVQTSSLAEA